MLSTLLGQQNYAKVQSLESIGANVMIADAKLNITYMNAAVRAMLQEAEADLKKELPRFSMANLIGSNIDIFHKDPSHQRRMLAALTKPHTATIRVGQWQFDLHVSPLRRGGKTAGFVVEWADAKARLMNLDYQAQMDAIFRFQAVIEFNTDGTIVTANDNFLKTLGYTLEEIRGRHHSMFMEKSSADSPEYTQFWADLREGKFQTAEFRRIGKNGKAVVINASYNPIADPQGKIGKIVKFATDVTDRVNAVSEIGEGLRRLAEGRLDFKLDRPFAKDFEPLRGNFNEAVGKLSETMVAISRSTSEIDNGSREISRSAQDLSKRTEQQAASLEETAAALDEITTNVSNSTKRAEEASRAASEANANAAHSGKVVTDAMGAMARIEASSNQISSIIGVIDEIAFQTNLLALNAGVEAARAGEAGKGFAVVAQEVRELAQRSAKAAKEIKDLIRTSSSEVKTGVELVTETGQALTKIQDSIIVVNDHMTAIAHASQEQSVGLNEVNGAINQMDQVTQQNAAMVEESTAASATLADETARLRERIGMFQLGSGGAVTGPRAVNTEAPGRAAPPSPARDLIKKVARSVGSAAAASDQWQEF